MFFLSTLPTLSILGSYLSTPVPSRCLRQRLVGGLTAFSDFDSSLWSRLVCLDGVRWVRLIKCGVRQISFWSKTSWVSKGRPVSLNFLLSLGSDHGFRLQPLPWTSNFRIWALLIESDSDSLRPCFRFLLLESDSVPCCMLPHLASGPWNGLWHPRASCL